MSQHPCAFQTPVSIVSRPDKLLRREAAAAAEAASALQQHLEQAQQELSRLAAEREELLLECDNLRTAVSFTGGLNLKTTVCVPFQSNPQSAALVMPEMWPLRQRLYLRRHLR